jgi:hypothetical protein
MTMAKKQDYIQILTYIRRRRDLTPEQFLDHWENVHAHKVIPWAEKHGIIRYQQVYSHPQLEALYCTYKTCQIHISGSMVPVVATASAPNAFNNGDLPATPIEFDGIAMFLVSSLDKFMEAFKDPYYIDVVEPDEREMLDKEGPGSGIVASFQGKMLDVTLVGKSVSGDKGKGLKYRKLFEEYQRRET